jgi:aminobenzoyl-glutamate transport protein
MLIIWKLMKNRLLTFSVLLLCVAELLLVLLSWMLSSLMVDDVRSLLSSEGIRWFLGQYTEMVQSPLLVYILLLAMAAGVLGSSGLLSRRKAHHERLVLYVVSAILLGYLAVLAALTLLPHAILLSATGKLFPSPFSRSLIPLTAFGVLLISMAYGIMTRAFTSVTMIIQAAARGLSAAAPLLLVYLLLMQFCESLRFVFSLSLLGV